MCCQSVECALLDVNLSSKLRRKDIRALDSSGFQNLGLFVAEAEIIKYALVRENTLIVLGGMGLYFIQVTIYLQTPNFDL